MRVLVAVGTTRTRTRSVDYSTILLLDVTNTRVGSRQAQGMFSRYGAVVMPIAVAAVAAAAVAAAAASASILPTHPEYYDKIRLSPEGMGVVATRLDTVGSKQGQQNHRSNVVQVDLATGETYSLADITALLPYTIAADSDEGTTNLKVASTTSSSEAVAIASDADSHRPGVNNDAAALLLAIHHFNNKLTPQIIGPLSPAIAESYANCPVRLTTELFDTGYSPIQSTSTLTGVMERSHTPLHPLPVAVLGAFRSASTSPTAILSGVHGIPQLSYRSSSTDFDNKEQYPYFGRSIPSSASEARAVVTYLKHLGVQYVGVIFVTDTFGSSYQKSLQDAAGEIIRTDSVSFGYAKESADNGDEDGSGNEDIKNAVAGLVSTGYRYFVALVGEEHFEKLMREAIYQGLAGPEYVWIFVSGVDRTVWQKKVRYAEDDILSRVTNGMAFVQIESMKSNVTLKAEVTDNTMVQSEEFKSPAESNADTPNDRFRRAWSEALSDVDMVEYFKLKQPDVVHENQFEFSLEPSQFSYFIYDAIQSLGLSMCMANKDTGPFFLGVDSFENFTKIAFSGASGDFSVESSGNRMSNGVVYTVWNSRAARAASIGESVVGFDLYPTAHMIPALSGEANEIEVETVQPFLYNDGTFNQPCSLPPPDVNYNYIGTAARSVGYTLVSFIYILVIFCLVWTIMKKKTRVVSSSHPTFLVCICLGCTLMASAIIPLSLEETVIKSKAGLDAACLATPWFYFCGFAVVFGALSTKTMSNYKAFRQPDIQPPGATSITFFKYISIFLLSICAILLAWTLTSPRQWTRKDGDSKDEFDRSIDSYAYCTSDYPFEVVLWVVTFLWLIIGCFINYRTRDVATDYNESKFVALAMASILQAAAMGIPIMVVVRNSPQGTYFVRLAIDFVTSGSNLLLIFIPKMRSLKKEKQKEIEEIRRTTVRNVTARRRGREQEAFDDEEEEQEEVTRDESPQPME